MKPSTLWTGELVIPSTAPRVDHQPDQVLLLLDGEEEVPALPGRHGGHEAVSTPVRHAGDYQLGDPRNARLLHERRHVRHGGGQVAHADLVAAVAYAHGVRMVVEHVVDPRVELGDIQPAHVPVASVGGQAAPLYRNQYGRASSSSRSPAYLLPASSSPIGNSTTRASGPAVALMTSELCSSVT